MVDIELMMKNFLNNNRRFNKQLKFNQNGYIRKVLETNYPEQYSNLEGYEQLSYDEDLGLYKIEYYSKETKPFRLREKLVSEDEKDYITILIRNGMGAYILNMNTCPKSILDKIINVANKN